MTHGSTAAIAWLKQRHPAPALTSVGWIERPVERGARTETSRHIHITSLPADAVPLARTHWRIENNLHWILDVIFPDDPCRMRTGNGPQNVAVVRHIALDHLKQANGKTSLKGTREKAGWSNHFLETVINGTP